MPGRKIGRRLHQAARVASLVALQHGASKADALAVRLQVLAALERDENLQPPPGCVVMRRFLAQPLLSPPPADGLQWWLGPRQVSPSR